MPHSVDLDQLAALVHDLTGGYSEHPTAGSRDRAAQALDRRLKAALNDLRALDVTFDHGLPVPASIPACRQPWTARSLIATVRQILRQQRTLQTLPLPSGGLLTQLARAADRTLTSPDGGERIHSSKPGSRPPASLHALDLLAQIEAAVWTHDADLRDALADHLNVERPWLTALDALPALCRRLPDPEHHPLTQAVSREVNSWRRTCRVALRYAAPSVQLANDCPECGQQTLRVSADMDSDITCTGRILLLDPAGEPLEDRDGQPLIVRCYDPQTGLVPRWSRHAWSNLLEAQHAAGLLTTDAAALLVNRDPSTIRRWRAEGKITPAGGTASHPLWLRADILACAPTLIPEQRTPITESVSVA